MTVKYVIFIFHNKNELLGNYFIFWELHLLLRKLLEGEILSQLSQSADIQQHLGTALCTAARGPSLQ